MAIKEQKSGSSNPRGLNREEIVQCFVQNGLEPFPELIDFELKYSGLILYAGLEPVEFGIIWGGGFPFDPQTAIIEFEAAETDDHSYDFLCARSNLPIHCTLDEKGRYYEDGELKFISFEDFLIADKRDE